MFKLFELIGVVNLFYVIVKLMSAIDETFSKAWEFFLVQYFSDIK